MTRVSTMGELAASLAHELNQPLTAILSNAQAAQRFMANNSADFEEVRAILADIVHDDSRAGDVIHRVRELLRKETREFVAFHLAGLIGDVVELLHSDAILHNVRVTLEPTQNLPQVWGDKIELQQVVLNLLINAFDAMQDVPESEREVVVWIEAVSGDTVRVGVRDSGPGLSPDIKDKVFEPFFTTKREGIGMGLSICRSIIEAHGGRLWAENNPEAGATFYFTVSVCTADDEQPPNHKL
jgi:two-component system, LuxR family, sensor kinase FixL